MRSFISVIPQKIKHLCTKIRHLYKMHGRTAYGITIMLSIAGCLIIGFWYFLTSQAASIFNYTVNHRQLFPGTITVSRLSANMLGQVSFENLEWRDTSGRRLATIPEGQFRVSIWDMLTGRIGTTTLKSATLNGGYVHLYFNDHMQLLGITPDTKETSSSSNEKEELSITGLKGNHKFICQLNLNNFIVETTSPDRHLVITNFNAAMDINTGKMSSIQCSTGHFEGTVSAAGFTLDGTIDFAPPVPRYDLALFIKDCNPKSLNVGIDIDDPASVRARIDGDLPDPIISGKLMLSRMTLPGLPFENVNGHFIYHNGRLDADNVTASVFDGQVSAHGNFDIDHKTYKAFIRGTNLKASQAAKGSHIRCLVTLDMWMSSDPIRHQEIGGAFFSGPGKYIILPFNRISGRFDKKNGVLAFHDVVISLALGDVTTDGFHFTPSGVRLDPIYLDNRLTGARERVY